MSIKALCKMKGQEIEEETGACRVGWRHPTDKTLPTIAPKPCLVFKGKMPGLEKQRCDITNAQQQNRTIRNFSSGINKVDLIKCSKSEQKTGRIVLSGQGEGSGSGPEQWKGREL